MSQQSNPEYVGKSFASIMVVAVTSDDLLRRSYEDRIVALLAKRGKKGIPAYDAVGTRGKVEEAQLRQALEKAGVDGVLITRVTSVERSSGTVPGSTVAVGIGYSVGPGWGGFYGFYDGVWQTVEVPPEQILGPKWTASETRLFDARNGALAWTGVVDTRQSDDFAAALTQYINVIFDAMVNDRVL